MMLSLDSLSLKDDSCIEKSTSDPVTSLSTLETWMPWGRIDYYKIQENQLHKANIKIPTILSNILACIIASSSACMHQLLPNTTAVHKITCYSYYILFYLPILFEHSLVAVYSVQILSCDHHHKTLDMLWLVTLRVLWLHTNCHPSI